MLTYKTLSEMLIKFIRQQFHLMNKTISVEINSSKIGLKLIFEALNLL